MLEFKVLLSLVLLLNPNLVFSPYNKSSLLSVACSFLASYGMCIVTLPVPSAPAPAQHLLTLSE